MRGGVIIKVGKEQVRVAAVEQAADEVGITLAVGIAAAHALLFLFLFPIKKFHFVYKYL